jgi:hypothetical protein
MMYRVTKNLCAPDDYDIESCKYVMFKVSPASLQIFTDTSNCVFEDRVEFTTLSL